MAAPATTAELLELVSKSGVADEARLRAYVAPLTATGSLPTDPADLAVMLVRDGFLTTFQSEQLLQGKWKELRVGGYTVLGQIGVTGTGMFFLCEHTKAHRVVTLKVLPPAIAEHPRSLEWFYREARVLSTCDHPNVVRAYDIDQDGRVHFLVTEYVDGANLNEILAKSGPLDPVRVAHSISQAAVGLQYLHDLGLVHRNIKPAKLTLARDGVIKVWDLSAALFVHEAPNAHEGSRVTPDYISPEQAADGASVDRRADIYSLGCAAYHLLTGRPPRSSRRSRRGATPRFRHHPPKKCRTTARASAKRSRDPNREPHDAISSLSFPRTHTRTLTPRRGLAALARAEPHRHHGRSVRLDRRRVAAG